VGKGEVRDSSNKERRKEQTSQDKVRSKAEGDSLLKKTDLYNEFHLEHKYGTSIDLSENKLDRTMNKSSGFN
jgi:hypothetical protein